MKASLKTFLLIAAMSLLPTFAIWLPFYFRLESFWSIPLPREGIATLARNYDGPLYIVVAKTLYNQELISQNFSFSVPPAYYAAHFPLFPILIRIFAVVAGFPWGMLAVTAAS